MTVAPFDTLQLAQRLRDDAGLSQQHAEGAAKAIADVMSADLVTKDYLDFRLKELENTLTLRLGGMGVVLAGIVLGAIRFMLPHGG
jgi:hypothetical protein